MEKFGIFELLDALSALMDQEESKEEAPSEKRDAAFDPPQYAAAEQKESAKTKKVTPDGALAGFYARHDAVAKKAKK